jgi:hypothetical protein
MIIKPDTRIRFMTQDRLLQHLKVKEVPAEMKTSTYTILDQEVTGYEVKEGMEGVYVINAQETHIVRFSEPVLFGQHAVNFAHPASVFKAKGKELLANSFDPRKHKNVDQLLRSVAASLQLHFVLLVCSQSCCFW